MCYISNTYQKTLDKTSRIGYLMKVADDLYTFLSPKNHVCTIFPAC
jgi:hypothetical protein